MDNDKPKREPSRPNNKGDQFLIRDAALIDAYNTARHRGESTIKAKRSAAKFVKDQFGFMASVDKVERALAKHQSSARQKRDGVVLLLSHSFQEALPIPDDVLGSPELEEFFTSAKNIHHVSLAIGPLPSNSKTFQDSKSDAGKRVQMLGNHAIERWSLEQL